MVVNVAVGAIGDGVHVVGPVVGGAAKVEGGVRGGEEHLVGWRQHL